MKFISSLRRLKDSCTFGVIVDCGKFCAIIGLLSLLLTLCCDYAFGLVLSHDVLIFSFFFLSLICILIAYSFATDFKEMGDYLTNIAFKRDVKPPVLTSYFGKGINKPLSLLNETLSDAQLELSKKIIESKLIFDSIPDGILILDDKLFIHKANDAAHEFLGSSLIGQQIANIINDKKLIGVLHLSLHEKKSKKTQVAIEAVISKTFLVKIEPMFLNNSGQNFLLLVMDDITEIMQVERSFTDFVTNASHEVRTPLTSVIGIAEILIETKDPEAYSQFLPVILSQANRMKQLINDLLSLASIERQINSRPSQIVNIKDILEEVEKQCEWDLLQSKNNLIINTPKNLPKVIGDYNQIIQILYNLVSNAIKYGKQHADIVVNIGRIKSLPYKFSKIIESEKYIFISIKDQGDGIDPKNLMRLTEKFFRIDSSRSRKVGGVGLGLSIVKQILNRHGGFLDIKSIEGEGSEFIIYLPIYTKIKG